MGGTGASSGTGPRRRLSPRVAWAALHLALLGTAHVSALEVAEGWVLHRWGLEDGLPVVGVNALERGETGYLWLASFGGLIRFDGVRFQRIDRAALPSRRLTTLHRGREGDLWVSTETLQLARHDGDALHPVAPPDQGGEKVRGIAREPDGGLLFAVGQCLYPEAPEGLGPARACLERGTIRSFAATAGGTLWLGTLDGGLHRKPPGGSVERVPAVSAERAVNTLAPGEDGSLWVGTSHGLLRLTGDRVDSVPLGGGPSEVVRIEPAEGGGVWAATSGGLYRVGDGGPPRRIAEAVLTGTEPIRFVHRGEPWRNLGRALVHDGVEVLRTDSAIKDVLSDPEGNLWVATSEQGLLQLRRSSITALDAADGLPSGPVYPVVEGPPGTAWLGLHGEGLARVRDGRVEVLGGPGDPESAYIWSILPPEPQGTPDGTPPGVLVGGRGLWRYRDGGFARMGPPDLTGSRVLALFRDRSDRVWVGTERRGIFRRERHGRWRHFSPEAAGQGDPDRTGLPLAAVQAFLESRNGALWIATAGGGLVRRAGGRFEVLSRRRGFPSDSLRALWEDGEGDLWVGTEDRGVVRVRLAPGAPLSSAELAVVDRRHGLFANGIHRILPDDRDRLWMSSNRGVFRVSEAELRAVADGRAESLRSVSYTEADGLPAREANGGVQSAGMRAGDGRLWFPTVQGVGIIDPSGLHDNPVPPPVVVEALRRPGGGEALSIPDAGSPLRLGPELRTFEVEYTALSFADPERVRFRVLLEGLTRDWIDVGTRREMLFTDVPPGRYRFRVKAANEHGVWSPEGAAIPLVVVPRWWETGATRWGGAALLAVLAAVAVARRMQRHRRRERRLEGLVEKRTEELADALQQATHQAEALREADAAKSRFFAHLSHELRTPLTLLVGPLLDAETDPDRLAEEAPVMRRAAQSLSRMVEQILDLEKADAGRLEISPEPRDLGRLAGRVVEAFAGLAERWGIELRCEAPGEDRPGPVASVDLEQMERALANLVSNALRFTPDGGRVTIRAFRGGPGDPAGGEAILEVEDTGQGIPEEALPRIFDRFYQVGFEGFEPGRTRGTGIGLALVRELVELHGGRVEVASEVGRGSTFRLCLPRSREAPVPLEDGAEPEPASPPDSEPAFWNPVGSPSPGPEISHATDPDPDDPRQTVLVVEDHAGIRRSVCRLLGADYRTVPAPDGASGLRLARRLLPDLVVADVSMPEMDGFELARRLGADPETAGVPVLFLTARAAEADAREGFAAGAVGYVKKPFAGDVLRAQVASLLRRQRRLAERLRRAGHEAAPDEPAPSPRDDLAARARRAILERVDDETFGPADLGRELAMGRSQLFERFRDELGVTPTELLRAVRLERGRELLAEGAGSVSEVAYAVGFTSLGGFSRAYRARYGEPPSAALDRGTDSH
ncbi:MAG: ATP-binding protein [Thermoanaerobaculia bacterium]